MSGSLQIPIRFAQLQLKKQEREELLKALKGNRVPKIECTNIKIGYSERTQSSEMPQDQGVSLEEYYSLFADDNDDEAFGMSFHFEG